MEKFLRLLVLAAFAVACSFGPADAQPAAQAVPYLLLANASASGPVVTPNGAMYNVGIAGTFGGATIAIVATDAFSNTVTLGSYTSAPSYPTCIIVPAGYTLQATVTGGSPSGLYLTLGGVAGGCGGASGGSSSVMANQGTKNAGGAASWPVQGAGAAGSVVSGNPNLIAGSDGTNARTITTDANGNQYTILSPSSASASAITPTLSAINASSLILKASAGNLYDAYVYSSSAGNLIIYNSTTVPGSSLTDANVLECVPVAAGGFASVNFSGLPPERYSTGIVMLFSSAAGQANCDTFTASATAKFHGRFQ